MDIRWDSTGRAVMGDWQLVYSAFTRTVIASEDDAVKFTVSATEVECEFDAHCTGMNYGYLEINVLRAALLKIAAEAA